MAPPTECSRPSRSWHPHGDVAYNTQADGKNVGVYVGFGIGKAGKDWYHDALKNAGDWGVAYTYT